MVRCSATIQKRVRSSWDAGPRFPQQGLWWGHQQATAPLGLYFCGLRPHRGRERKAVEPGPPELMAPDSHFLSVKPPSSLPTNYLEVFQILGLKRDFLGDLGWTGEPFLQEGPPDARPQSQKEGLFFIWPLRACSLFTDFLVLLAFTEPPATGASVMA